MSALDRSVALHCGSLQDMSCVLFMAAMKLNIPSVIVPNPNYAVLMKFSCIKSVFLLVDDSLDGSHMAAQAGRPLRHSAARPDGRRSRAVGQLILPKCESH